MKLKELNDAKYVILNKLFEKEFFNEVGLNFTIRGLIYEYVNYKLKKILSPILTQIEHQYNVYIIVEYKVETIKIKIEFYSLNECEKEWKYHTVKHQLQEELGMKITKEEQINKIMLYIVYDRRLEALYFTMGDKIQQELENLKSQIPNDINTTVWDTAISQIKQHL